MENNTVSSKMKIGAIFQNNKFRWLVKNLLLPIALAVIILFTSGYAKTTTRQGSFNSTMLFVLCGIAAVFVILTVFKTPIEFCKTIVHPIKNKLYKNLSLYFIIGMFVLFISFLLVYFSYGNDIFTIAHYILLIIFGFTFTFCVPFKVFSKYYNKILFYIAVFSLIVFIIMLFAGDTKFYSSTFMNGNEASYRSLLGLYFRIDVGFPRNYGPFWEPGIFSLMLIIGILFEIINAKKINIVYIAVYILTIISTFSTSALLLLPFCVPLFFAVRKKKKSFWISFPLAFVFSGLIIILGNPSFNIPFFSDVFSKLFVDGETGSFLTRLYSPLYGMYLFAKSGGIGFGPNIFDAKYEILLMFGNPLPIQQTSTFGWIAGSFGIPGLFFVISSFTLMFLYINKKYDVKTGILLFVFTLIIINCEPMYSFSFFWIIAMYPLVNELKTLFKTNDYNTSIFSLIGNSNLNKKLAISNLSWSFIIKVVALLIGLLLYPQYVKYFGNQTTIVNQLGNETTYGAIALGAWLVILQILSWVLTFDIGIGNGLKNKIVEAINGGREDEIKNYISCSYISNFFIISALLIIGLPIIFSINFNNLLNISDAVVSTQTLQLAFALAFISICIEFFLKIVLNIYQALQKQVVASFVPLVSTIALIIFVYFVRFESMEIALISLSAFYIFSINVPLIITTIILFKGRFKNYRPSLKNWSFTIAKKVAEVGGLYFLIQIFLLVINSTNKILISNSYGADVVSLYEPYLKIFSAICAVASAISLPTWTLVLRADVKKDYAWIQKMEKTMLLIGVVFCIGSIVAASLMQIIFDIWLGGGSFMVDYFKSFMFALWSIATVASFFVSSFSNGLKILKPQLIILGVLSILKVPFFMLLKFVFPNLDWISLIIIDSIILTIYSIILIIINKKYLAKRVISAVENK